MKFYSTFKMPKYFKVRIEFKKKNIQLFILLTLFLILRSERGSFFSLSLSSPSCFCKLPSSPPSRDLCLLKPSSGPPTFVLELLPDLLLKLLSPPLSNELRRLAILGLFSSSLTSLLLSLSEIVLKSSQAVKILEM